MRRGIRMSDEGEAPPIDPRDQVLREALADAYPVEPAGERLRLRIAALDAPRGPGLWSGLPIRIAAAAAACLAAFLVLMTPHRLSATILDEAESAVAHARSAHLVRWRIPVDGPAHRERELWFQDGRWRLQDETGLQVFDGNLLWTRAADSTAPPVARRHPPHDAAHGRFTPAAALREFIRPSGSGRVIAVEETVLDGRPVRRVYIDRSARTTERGLLLLDRDTDLPLGWEIQRREEEYWRARLRTDATFNRPLPKRLFRVSAGAPETTPAGR